MEVMKVEKPLICTRRIDGLRDMGLRILRDKSGKQVVAVDPVGAREGNWVFTSSGSAARHAACDYRVLTDLTVAGIIDFWDADEYQ